MAKNANTFEKRRKEVEKKRKADEKRERRRARKQGGSDSEAVGAPFEQRIDEQEADTAPSEPVAE